MSRAKSRSGFWVAVILVAWPLALGGAGLLGLALQPSLPRETVAPAPAGSVALVETPMGGAAASGDAPAVIRNPSWSVRPDAQYPRAALAADIESGRVELTCEVLADGRVGACSVLNETPAGYGFAEAALAGTRLARLNPRQIDGFATDSSVRFPVVFRVE